MRRTAFSPVLCAMSVALLAQGEIVPSRDDEEFHPFNVSIGGVAIRQQCMQPRALGRVERPVGMDEMNESSAD
jgi:hypothetical protein